MGTRFFDDWLLETAGAGIRQVVLLAAGLEFKSRVLDKWAAVPSYTRVLVPANLGATRAEELLAADSDRSEPTGWLAEGLLIYLSATDAAQLRSTVGGLSAAGSWPILGRYVSSART